MSEVRRRQMARLGHELGGEINQALMDPMVTEVMLNPNGQVWIQQIGGQTKHIVDISHQEGMSMVNSMAALMGGTINEDDPYIEGVLPLPDGPRVSASIPPDTEAPQFSIRLKRKTTVTLAELIDNQTVSPEQAEKLRTAVRDRKTIVVVGATGSGKTTLLNALVDAIADVAPEDRVIAIEDSRELNLTTDNSFGYLTSEKYPMEAMVRRAMRNNPDRIIAGEVRGGEALAMLEAWMTGHPGMATFHARTDAGLSPILLRLNGMAKKLSPDDHMDLIQATIDYVVCIEREGNRRCVSKIFALTNGGTV